MGKPGFPTPPPAGGCGRAQPSQEEPFFIPSVCGAVAPTAGLMAGLIRAWERGRSALVVSTRARRPCSQAQGEHVSIRPSLLMACRAGKIGYGFVLVVNGMHAVACRAADAVRRSAMALVAGWIQRVGHAHLLRMLVVATHAPGVASKIGVVRGRG